MATRNAIARPDALWAHHHALLRDPQQVAAQWDWPDQRLPRLLEHRQRGPWWDLLESLGVTLLVTREYEHLVLGLGCQGGRARVSYFRLPHPSGLAVDRRRGRVYAASTRNPNMLFEFTPCAGGLGAGRDPGVLLPSSCRHLPGSLYMHDLALIGGRLHANAVGLNAVVRFGGPAGFEPVWWPRSIESPSGPRFDKNYLQLNSIAAGASLAGSFFSASTAAPSRRRPGHLNFPVDRRGVIFSGTTREVIATGLTRPHSARRFGRQVWVDNSGYGQFGRIAGGRFEPLVQLPGWTRGLCFHKNIAFVGSSRVIPKFRAYAPGLDVDSSQCGLHAVDMQSGRVLASLVWPAGNQIFAIEAVDARLTVGFPAASPAGRSTARRIQQIFFRGVA